MNDCLQELQKKYQVEDIRRIPEYRTWMHMRWRCKNPNHKFYARYGGRGITICRRWDSFQVFYEDMGPRPTDYTIDRIDNDGNYEPGNCRWVSREINNRNKTNVILSMELATEIRKEYRAGKRMSELAEGYGVTPSMINLVIRNKKWEDGSYNPRKIGYQERGPLDKDRKYKGITFEKASGKWMAQIVFKRRNKKLGRFKTVQDAAAAYNKAIKEIHGEKVWLNRLDG